jgi:putative membrane protein
MLHDGYTTYGMHLIWWFIWGILLFWIFATPYDIPGQRHRRNSPLDVLRARLASGQITPEQYQEHKLLLETE